ncbi:MAG: 2-methylaconitate cis-trans isomerase PrpF [Terriglobales bacterium]|jgi:probable AcnD-accessory protein PrpF
MSQIAIPAVYMRGGTSKGVFFRADSLPRDPATRDRILLRVIGSPDPYKKHTDGMGGATSSTSKVALISPSSRPDCDVDYLFGQVSIERPLIDWSGNCGNLMSAVGPFSISEGLVKAEPGDGCATVRIWQANLGKKIIAYVPVKNGEVVEEGDFELDGVTFPAAEIRLELLEPGADERGDGGMFPTEHPLDMVSVPSIGALELTLINAGSPTIFADAAALGFTGIELQDTVNDNPEILARCESVRAHAAVKMGLAKTPTEASELRPHSPKLAYVAPPQAYVASSGKQIAVGDIDLVARIFSMGKLHHAMVGTAAVALAVAAAIPGTVVERVVGKRENGQVCLGHPSGVMTVGAEVEHKGGHWTVVRAVMSRSARRLMRGCVLVPSEVAKTAPET